MRRRDVIATAALAAVAPMSLFASNKEKEEKKAFRLKKFYYGEIYESGYNFTKKDRKLMFEFDTPISRKKYWIVEPRDFCTTGSCVFGQDGDFNYYDDKNDWAYNISEQQMCMAEHIAFIQFAKRGNKSKDYYEKFSKLHWEIPLPKNEVEYNKIVATHERGVDWWGTGFKL
ncbi:MAG: hypothetical protein ACW99G_03145 [Candidatus Thorarchaeota archaeon]|jgi:hypothetical protein